MRIATNTCAVCPKPIGTAYLMCASHWRLVPKDTAHQVLRTWGALQRFGTPLMRRGQTDAYQAARQAAIAAVQAQINPAPAEGAKP